MLGSFGRRALEVRKRTSQVRFWLTCLLFGLLSSVWEHMSAARMPPHPRQAGGSDRRSRHSLAASEDVKRKQICSSQLFWGPAAVVDVLLQPGCWGSTDQLSLPAQERSSGRVWGKL